MKMLVPTMKKILLPLALAATLSTNSRADYNPIALLTNSFNADVIVETNAPTFIGSYTTGSIDAGTNNTGSTFYEVGWNPNQPYSGIPAHGSTFFVSNGVPSSNDPHQFLMPASYNTNDCLFMGGANYPGSSPATFCVQKTGGTLTAGASVS